MSALDHKPLPLLLRPGMSNAIPHSDNCSPQKKNLLHYSNERKGSGFDPTCCYLIFFSKMHYLHYICTIFANSLFGRRAPDLCYGGGGLRGAPSCSASYRTAFPEL